MLLIDLVGYDENKIDYLFKQSKLYRDKWDDERYKNRTIQRGFEYYNNYRGI